MTEDSSLTEDEWFDLLAKSPRAASDSPDAEMSTSLLVTSPPYIKNE